MTVRRYCESPSPKGAAQIGRANRRTLSEDIKEYTAAQTSGRTATFDSSLIQADVASIFPRIKTTSLSTKRIVIHDEAKKRDLTLVLVAFRSFADEQLASWRRPFQTLAADQTQCFDVTINESFGAQALSGFVQRWQRSRTDAALHDFHVAFNSRAREPLETLLLSTNRMFGYALLLDGDARVRFRASGMATEAAAKALLSSAEGILKEKKGKRKV